MTVKSRDADTDGKVCMLGSDVDTFVTISCQTLHSTGREASKTEQNK